MRNLKKLFNECYDKLVAIGVPVSNNIKKVSTNSRLSTTYGRCSRDRKDNSFTIQIATFLLSDKLDESIVCDTIMHELIHTCDGCFNHGKLFQRYARMVNKAYNMNIGTYVDKESVVAVRESGLQPKRKKPQKDSWVFKCINVDCNYRWEYSRKPKWCKGYNTTNMVVQNVRCPHCKGKIQMTKYKSLQSLHQGIFDFEF